MVIHYGNIIRINILKIEFTDYGKSTDRMSSSFHQSSQNLLFLNDILSNDYNTPFKKLEYFPTDYTNVNYGKDFKKCRIKFVEAYTTLMSEQRFQKTIHTNIKNEIEAQRLCVFYQELADKEAKDLYCYVDYESLAEPIEVKKYVVRICNFKNVTKIRSNLIYSTVKQKLDNKDCIVLMQSYNRDFLIKVAKSVLKDFLKPFQLCIQERFFIAHGPKYSYNVLYIDTTRQLELSFDFI
jgi:hypothetical protein